MKHTRHQKKLELLSYFDNPKVVSFIALGVLIAALPAIIFLAQKPTPPKQLQAAGICPGGVNQCGNCPSDGTFCSPDTGQQNGTPYCIDANPACQAGQPTFIVHKCVNHAYIHYPQYGWPEPCNDNCNPTNPCPPAACTGVNKTHGGVCPSSLGSCPNITDVKTPDTGCQGGSCCVPAGNNSQLSIAPIALDPSLCNIDNVAQTYNCDATLSSLTTITWNSATTLPGSTSSPSAGTIIASQSAALRLVVPVADCTNNASASGSFTYTDQSNAQNKAATVFSCNTNGAGLSVSPGALDASICTLVNGALNCSVTVNNNSAQPISNITGQSTLANVTFNPSTSSLNGVSSAPVTVIIPQADCPSPTTTGTFTFSGQLGTKTATSNTVTFTCAGTPANSQIDVNPKNIGPNLGCSLDPTATNIVCNETITSGSTTGTQIFWTATGSGTLTGENLSKSSGSFPAGQSDTTQISVPLATCQSNQTGTDVFTFIGSLSQGGTAIGSVGVNFNCSAQNGTTLFYVSPTSLGPTTGCSTSGTNGNYACSIQINTSTTSAIQWTGVISGLTGATINPSTGSVVANGSQTSVLTIPSQFCQGTASASAQGTVQYTDNNNSQNSGTVTFACNNGAGGGVQINGGTQTPDVTNNNNPAQLLQNAAPFIIAGAFLWLAIFH